MKLKAHRIGFKGSAGQACPFNGVLAFLDPLFTDAALVLESHDLLGGMGHVGNNEADPGIQFAWMLFDLGDHPS